MWIIKITITTFEFAKIIIDIVAEHHKSYTSLWSIPAFFLVKKTGYCFSTYKASNKSYLLHYILRVISKPRDKIIKYKCVF